ncbi:hypothetical protein [Dictyobacter aurantiacus]|uniref:Intracellular proteinase inhibitor BsuPI domain-containing protein n=1 Tax=Dictyobacter aurantiacus TaxID=1936993 RepID=A0A401ZK78_9CHLR|nr:hypothetical protein [Dictyobacter aurantiacus]GCE07261.1 hypothetical protein KDAU_45900 [Dictyobacter aurantiacus]
MINKRSAIISVMFVLCLSMLAACGNTSQDDQRASQPPPAPTTQPTQPPHVQPPHRKVPVDPTPRPDPQPGATPTPGNPNPNPGGLQVAVNQASYSRTDAISITISNGLGQTIYLTTPRTSCTLAQLQMLVNGNWTPVGRCVNISATPTRQLVASGTMNQTIQPQNAFGVLHSVSSWQPGTYRVSVTYTTTYDPDTVGGGQQATSPTFTIT